jgi:hypothetical protein
MPDGCDARDLGVHANLSSAVTADANVSAGLHNTQWAAFFWLTPRTPSAAVLVFCLSTCVRVALVKFAVLAFDATGPLGPCLAPPAFQGALFCRQI